jgi:Beta-ketoacyl synthase, N-terminal domain
VRVYVEGVGLCGPGLAGWAASRPVLAGAEPYVPAPAIVPPSPLLPANERRRTVQTVKLALAVGTEAFAGAERDATETATVFASSSGDGDTLHGILGGLASEHREISPTRFHNSVHNAPAGYWNIATHSNAPSSSLCVYDASFAAGLLEAASQATVDDRAVGLIAYDLRYPEPLHSVRPIGALFGTALILTPWPTRASLVHLDIELRSSAGSSSRMMSIALEELRRSTPAARSLPLLVALARTEPAAIVVDYLPELELRLTLEPVVARTASEGDRLERSLTSAR